MFLVDKATCEHGGAARRCGTTDARGTVDYTNERQRHEKLRGARRMALL
jgi:hypothetical protein